MLKVAKSRKVLAPLILLTAVGIVSLLVTFRHLDMKEMTVRAMEQRGQVASPDQMEQMMPIVRGFAAAGAVPGPTVRQCHRRPAGAFEKEKELMKALTGRIAVVTGAGRGIALALSAAGAARFTSPDAAFAAQRRRKIYVGRLVQFLGSFILGRPVVDETGTCLMTSGVAGKRDGQNLARQVAF